MTTRRSPSSSPLAGRSIVLGVTGGIAAYKACTLTRLLTAAGADVRVVMTDAATNFVGPTTFAALSRHPVGTSLWASTEDVPHVRLAHDADLIVVAPATANSLARFALGFADDLLSATVLEAACPILVAPAMHTGMYADSATQENLALLSARGVRIVGPVDGALAAGDRGLGRMAEPETIFDEAEALIGRGRDMDGVEVVITAGPTWEPVDAVRFLGNRSTGKMGFALAREALQRGARVQLIVGPGTVPPPDGPSLQFVGTSEEMLAAVQATMASADVLIMAAAVADFRPRSASQGKIKKDGGVPVVDLEQTPDILALVAANKGATIVIGFAAETDDLEAAARDKLRRKGADVIVVNEVGRAGTGFGADTDNAGIVAADGDDVPLQMWTKPGLARAVIDRVVKLRTTR